MGNAVDCTRASLVIQSRIPNERRSEATPSQTGERREQLQRLSTARQIPPVQRRRKTSVLSEEALAVCDYGKIWIYWRPPY